MFWRKRWVWCQKKRLRWLHRALELPICPQMSHRLSLLMSNTESVRSCRSSLRLSISSNFDLGHSFRGCLCCRHMNCSKGLAFVYFKTMVFVSSFVKSRTFLNLIWVCGGSNSGFNYFKYVYCHYIWRVMESLLMRYSREKLWFSFHEFRVEVVRKVRGNRCLWRGYWSWVMEF